MTELETAARVFATAAHEGQVRKYTGEPYIVHPYEVAELIRGLPNHTPAMLAAAWLHDVVEDTPVTIGEIRVHFGPEVGDLVEMLTDVSRPEDGNRAGRKRVDLEHTAQGNPQAHTIKLADLISNSRTIVKYDPGFAQVYLREKKALLEVLKDGNPTLFIQAQRVVEENLHALA